MSNTYKERIPKSSYARWRIKAGSLPRGAKGLHRIDSRMNARSTGRDSSSSNVGTTNVRNQMNSTERYQETDTDRSQRQHLVRHALMLVHRGGEQQLSWQYTTQGPSKVRYEVEGHDRIKRHTVSTPAENVAPARNAISVSLRPKSISRASKNFANDGPESGSFYERCFDASSSTIGAG